MRLILAFLLALSLPLTAIAAVAVAAPTAATVHERGEFRFSVAPVPDFVVVNPVAERWTANAGGSGQEPWRHWQIDQQVDRRDCRYVFFHDLAYEAGSQRMLGEAGKFSIPFSPEFQTLTLHSVQVRRDGAWIDRLDPDQVSLARRETGFEDDMADGQVSALIVLEDVRVGDVVRVAFTVEGSNPILAGHVASTFVLATGSPILVRRGRVLFDGDVATTARALGDTQEFSRRRIGAAQEIAFVREDVAAVRDTDDYPNWYRAYPTAEIGPEESWSDVVAWALPLYPDQAELPADLERRLQGWKALDDPFRIAGAVLRTTQDDIRYFGTEMGDNTHRPNPPSLVWSRRYGDCKDKAYLTALLLRRLGLDAVPALVSTSEGKAIAEALPAASAFNHVIVRLRVAGKDYWLDPTLSQQRGDLRQLDLYDYGVALPVAAGTTAPVPVLAPPQVRNEVLIREKFTPAADGRSVDLRIETRYRGDRAETMRRRLRDQSFETMAENWADYYRKRYGELSVATPATVDEDDDENTMVIVEHYRLDDPWQRHGSSALLDTFADALAESVDLPAQMTRDEPLALMRPETLRHEIRIELPPGWVLATTPGTIAAAGGPMRYRRVLSNTDGVVEITHEMKNDRDYVASEQMRDYLAGLRDAKEAAGMRLAFGMSVDVRNSERDRRLRALLRGELATPEQDD